MAALRWGARPTTMVAWAALSPFSGISSFVEIPLRNCAMIVPIFLLVYKSSVKIHNIKP